MKVIAPFYLKLIFPSFHIYISAPALFHLSFPAGNFILNLKATIFWVLAFPNKILLSYHFSSFLKQYSFSKENDHGPCQRNILYMSDKAEFNFHIHFLLETCIHSWKSFKFVRTINQVPICPTAQKYPQFHHCMIASKWNEGKYCFLTILKKTELIKEGLTKTYISIVSVFLLLRRKSVFQEISVCIYTSMHVCLFIKPSFFYFYFYFAFGKKRFLYFLLLVTSVIHVLPFLPYTLLLLNVVN